MIRRAAGAAAVLAVSALGLAACSSTSLVVGGSTVRVASAQPVTSLNDQTAYGNTMANRSIVAATNAGFNYYDDTSLLVRDESFGHYEIVSRNPFAVRYTVANGVTWSDGVLVDAADLLLAWAANSGKLNTEGFNAERFVDAETGLFGAFPDDTVYFDGQSRSGLQFVSAVPEIADDSRSITLTYDAYFVDWELAFDVGMPAHVVAEQALSVKATEKQPRAEVAKQAVIDAILDVDASRLAPLAVAWNTAFVVNEATPLDLFVGSGPYSVTAIEPNESVTLTANALYTGDRKPRFETVRVMTIADPLEAVAALGRGEVDVIAPIPTPEVLEALTGLDGVQVQSGEGSAFEHLDLQFSGAKNPTFTDPLLREAFLLTVPRQQIVHDLVRPSAGEARVRDSLLLVDAESSVPPQNLSKARRLVTESAVAGPVVCILFDPANPRRVAEFELIAASAEDAGFVVTDCSRSDWEDFLGVDGAYDAALFAWNESTAAVSAPAARLRSNSTLSNFSHYASDTVDSLLDQLAVTEDASEQRELLEKIDEELRSDFYGLALYQFPALVAHRDDIDNATPARLGAGLLWNVWQWQPAAKAE